MAIVLPSPPIFGLTAGRVVVAAGAATVANSAFTISSNVLDLASAGTISFGTSIATSVTVGGSNLTSGITLGVGGSASLVIAVGGVSKLVANSSALSPNAALGMNLGSATLPYSSIFANVINAPTTSLTLDSASNGINIGISTAGGVAIGRVGTLITIPGGIIRATTPGAGVVGVNIQLGPGNGGSAAGIGNAAAAGGTTSLIAGFGGNGDANNAPANGANAIVQSGSAGTVGAFGGGANSGSIVLNVGAASGTGTQGNISIQNASVTVAKIDFGNTVEFYPSTTNTGSIGGGANIWNLGSFTVTRTGTVDSLTAVSLVIGGSNATNVNVSPGGSTLWQFTGAGGMVPAADGTQQIGSSGLRVATYVGNAINSGPSAAATDTAGNNFVISAQAAGAVSTANGKASGTISISPAAGPAGSGSFTGGNAGGLSVGGAAGGAGTATAVGGNGSGMGFNTGNGGATGGAGAGNAGNITMNLGTGANNGQVLFQSAAASQIQINPSAITIIPTSTNVGSIGSSTHVWSQGFFTSTSSNTIDTLTATTLAIGTSLANNFTIGNSSVVLGDIRGQGLIFRAQIKSSGSGTAFTFIPSVDTGLNNAEFFNYNLSAAASQTLTGGGATIGSMRNAIVQPPTYAAAAAQTITTAATLAITGAPVAGTNVTITNAYALWVQAAALFSSSTTFSSGILTNTIDTITGVTLNIGTATATGIIIGSTAVSTNSQLAKNFTFTSQSTATTGTKPFLFTTNAITAQTASTELSGVNFNLTSSRQWNTGAITTQREFLVQAPTYTFVGASTITTAATVAVSGPPIAGTNATITNAYPLLVNNDGITTSTSAMGISVQNATAALVGVTVQNSPGIEMLGAAWNSTGTVSQQLKYRMQVQPATNAGTIFGNLNFAVSVAGGAYTTVGNFDTSGDLTVGGFLITGNGANGFGVTASSLDTNAAGTLTIGGSTATTVAIGKGAAATITTSHGQFTATQGVITALGNVNAFKVVGGAHTNMTLSTEINSVNFALNRTVQWATGAIGTQREFLIQNPTYAFVGASTITNAATVAITGAPVAGTNATITNSYALLVQQAATGNGIAVTGNAANFQAQAVFKDSNGNGHFGVDDAGFASLGMDMDFREQWAWNGAAGGISTTPVLNSATVWSFANTGGTYSTFLGTGFTGYPTNMAMSLTASTVSANRFMLTTTQAILETSRLTNMYAVLEWDAGLTIVGANNVTYYMGFWINDPTTAAHPNGIYFSKASTDSNWQCNTDNNVTTTTTTSGVAPTANVMQRFRIEFYGSASMAGALTAKFYINGALVATNTTNVSATTWVIGFAGKNTATATAQSMLVGRVRCVANLIGAVALT